MNGKIPASGNNWTMTDLTKYGFKPYEYYEFKSEFGRWWHGIFGDKLFTVNKEFRFSTFRMNYEDYFIYCDDMGYVDVYYQVGDKGIPEYVLYSRRRDVTLTDMFDAIKHHRRGIRLKDLENELV